MTTIESGKTAGTVDNGAVPIERFRSLTSMALSSIQHIYGSVPPTRETLTVLFAVDAAQTNPTEAWIGFFVETASAQLIWDDRPTGTLTSADAVWVLDRFDEAPRLSVLALLVRMIDEAARMPVDFAAEVRRRATLFTDLNDQPAAPSRRSAVPYLRLVA